MVQTKKMGKADISTVNNRIFVNLHLGQLSDFHLSDLSDEILLEMDKIYQGRLDTMKKSNARLNSSDEGAW